MTPKLIAFDLDSTLAESKQPLSWSMGEHLVRLLEKMPVAVMSGAAFHQFEGQFLAELPGTARLDRLYIFSVNAGQCYTWGGNGWKIIYDHNFKDEERQTILRALDEALKKTGLYEQPEQVWGERIEDRGAQISFSGLGQHAPLEAKKSWDPAVEKRQSLHDALVPLLPNFSVSIGGSSTIDITQKGVTKAYGIEQLSKITNIPIPEMLYVGDELREGGNDAVVIQTGIPTAAVNSPKEAMEIIEKILAENR